MNVSSVSSPAPDASSSATLLSQIEKQIEAVTKEIQDETASKDDAKTKAERIQVYQEELLALQLQLQQVQERQQQARVAAAGGQEFAPVKAGVDDGVGRSLSAMA
jgi:predicted ribosome quality control (RQC) complex YloA/Tae2 family protein